MKIDFTNLEQYKSVFGMEKMKLLWNEFCLDAENKLKNIETKTSEEQRLAYHSLRSSSLVFGMTDFSELCTSYEERILNQEKIESTDAEASRSLLKESMIQIDNYLK